MPYSLVPIATWLVVGGAIVWKRANETWQRGIGFTAFGGGTILSLIILVLAYMVFNGRLVHEVIPMTTPVPTRVGMVVDNRTIRQKTQIPYGNPGNFKCTPNPVALTLTAQIEPQTLTSTTPFSQTLQIEGKGFAPNETLNIFLREFWADAPRTLAFNEQVNDDGTFSRNESVTWHAPQVQWRLWIVHQRGTACVQFVGN